MMNNSAASVPVTMEPVDPVHRYGCGHGRLKAGHTIDVKRNTVKIEPDLNDTEKYHVTFSYDAQVDGCITVCIYRWVGQEKKEVFKTSKNAEKRPGLVQKFNEKGDGVKFPLHKTGLKDVYKLEIVAQADEDGSKNCILEKTEAVVQNKSGITKVKVKNQILSVNGRMSVFVDLNGHSYSTQTDADDPYNGCCICFDEKNPGIVFPIGGLLLIEKPIAEESNGNCVYKGTYDESPVIAGRIPKGNGTTDEMIQILKRSNPHHSNVLWRIAEEENEDFVFFIYESFECTLHDLITGKYELKCLDGFMDLKLWKPDGFSPSKCLVKLLRGIVEGIVCLIKLGNIPNLNPRMIIIEEGTSSLTGKVLGMGISSTGQTAAWDSLDLGKLLVFCITSDYLPFDLEDVKDHLKRIPEAFDLISRLQHHNPKSRPTAKEVCDDIFFWDAKQHLSFIEDVSDCVDPDVCNAKAKILQLLNITDPPALRGKWVKSQKLDNVTNSKILKSLESLQGYSNWNTLIHPTLINNLERHRYYDYDSVCDLLRFIRNCSNHYKTLWNYSKRLLGGVEGLSTYFSSKFPKLILGTCLEHA
ncbi:unnamed protein product [Lactuca saligna]|uniref:KEN domain-containing protein n=1 Tax=Lactuca saligna TaxID=75948 RepID=A0AA35V3W7_LACSI|nr:unnamed protein product [Lactuca saligna]